MKKCETRTVDKVKRPVHNSKGKVISEELKYLRTFWKWFDGSILINSRGQPMVIYHGTPNEIEGDFILTQNGDYGTGIYFSPNHYIASLYGKNIIECYLKVTNPVILPTDNEEINTLIKENKIEELKEKGFDGIVVYKESTMVEVSVWDNEQIRVIEPTNDKKSNN